MAQAKREQINIVGKDAAPMTAEVNTVPDLLLQKHRLFSISNTASRLSFRLFFMLTAGALAFITNLSITHLFTSMIVAVLSAYVWHSEKEVLVWRIKVIERVLAQRSGEDWEDTYIISRNQRSDVIRKYHPRYEPFIWTTLVVLLAAWRIVSIKLGL